MFKHIKAQADEASMQLAIERGPCPDAADTGAMERFSCKMAIAPTASISIICGGTSACIEPIPANIYTHKTLSGSFSVKNPYLEKILVEKSKNSETVWNSILENGGSVQHLDFLSAEEKDCYKTSFEIDQRWLLELAGDRAPIHRSGAVAEPVHPRRRREMGPADAPLPRVGTGHQVALLPPLEKRPARGFRGRGRGRQYDRRAEIRVRQHRITTSVWRVSEVVDLTPPHPSGPAGLPPSPTGGEGIATDSPSPLVGEGGSGAKRRGRVRGNADGLTKRQLLPADTTAKARALRRTRTELEDRLWRALREAFPEAKFRFQVPLGRYFADFCSHRAKLIVEVDGDTHADQVAYDERRTRFLNDEGYQVIRFTNPDVMHNLEGVLTAIATHIPSPPVGEGGSDAQRRGRMRGSRSP